MVFRKISVCILCAFLVPLCISCSTSTIVVDKKEMSKVDTIAVTRFERVEGVPQDVAEECEERFTGHFMKLGKKVVERERLESLLEETIRSQSGIVNHAREIGRISGADALLLGKVTQYDREVRWVEYYDYVKNKYTKKTEKIKKRKRKKFFSFQLRVRLVSVDNGSTILTLMNKYPERSCEMTSSTTLTRYMTSVLKSMGDDLEKALEKD